MKHFGSALLWVMLVIAIPVWAHHNVPAEYGSSATPTNYIEGQIRDVTWGNPHIFLNITTTGGEVSPGENWRLTTHPINVMTNTYGFEESDFTEGDTVQLYGWFHLRGQPLFQIRAISINQGPMRSTLRFSDLRDILDGSLQAKKITPTEHINGTSPQRAGAETVTRLAEVGYLDENGNVNLPDSILYPEYAVTPKTD